MLKTYKDMELKLLRGCVNMNYGGRGGGFAQLDRWGSLSFIVSSRVISILSLQHLVITITIDYQVELRLE